MSSIKFRKDIEVLRAIAIILIVISSSNIGLRGGFIGVDVFFVISGFLITKQIYDKIKIDSSFSLKNFYARRILKMLPASLGVILLTLLLSIVGLSSPQVTNYGWDAFFSSLSLINFRLAFSGADYMNRSGLPSPFEHFWSIALVVQFYFVLTIVISLLQGLYIGKNKKAINMENQNFENKNKRSIEKFKNITTLLLITIVFISLLLSYTITTKSQAWAFFGLHTRAWQLAVGSIIGLNYVFLGNIKGIKLTILSWIGFVGLLIGLYFINEKTVYPGLWSLIPTISTALILIGGFSSSKYSFESIFGNKVFLWISKISFSWYLVHWPIFVLMQYNGYENFTIGAKLGVILITFVLGNISYYVLEKPIKINEYFNNNIKSTYVLGLSLLIISIGTSYSLQLFKGYLINNPSTLKVNTSEIADFDLIQNIEIGSKAKQLPKKFTLPLIGKNTEQESKFDACLKSQTAQINTDSCTFGNNKSARTIAIVGDEQARNWLSAIHKIGTVNSYKVVLITNQICFDVSSSDKIESCQLWKNESIATINSISPEIVILSESNNNDPKQNKSSQYVEKLKLVSKKVVRLLPISSPPQNIKECINKNPNTIFNCNFAPDKPQINLDQKKQDTTQEIVTIDPNDLICIKNTCPLIIDEISVYDDNGYLTSEYSNYISNYISLKLVTTNDITPQKLKEALRQTTISQSIKPTLLEASSDFTEECMDDWLSSKPDIKKSCTLGDKNSTKTIALIGDSHAQHWIQTLEPFATKHGFKIITYIKKSCSFTDIDIFEDSYLKRLYFECNSWRKNAIEQLESVKPDTIIWSEQIFSNSDSIKYEETVKKLFSITNGVIKIIDTPRATTFVPECLARNGNDIQKCNYKKNEGIHNKQQVAKESEINKKLNVSTIQTLDWFCYIDQCPVVIDNIIVFRDPNHITSTFANYLREPMERKLLEYFPEITK